MFRNQNAPPAGGQYGQQQQQPQGGQQQQVDGQEQQGQPETMLKLAATGGNIDLSQAYGADRRTQSGKFTLAQLRATEGICPLQNGTNQFDSQKGKTGFGTPRNTQKRVEFAEDDVVGSGGGQRRAHRWACLLGGLPDTEVRLQSGTNKFESQKKMTGFGTPRDVKGKHLKRIWELEFPEEAADYQPPVNQAPQQYQQFQQGGQQQQQAQPQYQQQQPPQAQYQQQQPPQQAQRPGQQQPPQAQYQQQQAQPQRPVAGQPSPQQQPQQGQYQQQAQRPGAPPQQQQVSPQQQYQQQQAQRPGQPGQQQQLSPQQQPQQYQQYQQQQQRPQGQQGQPQAVGNAAPATAQKGAPPVQQQQQGNVAPSFRQ